MEKSEKVKIPSLPKPSQSTELQARDDAQPKERQEEESETKTLTRFQKFLDSIGGDEKRRFLTGSVLVPLLIATITIRVGACIASDYQDWQDRRSRTRDIIDGTREATTKLSLNLEALAQKGSSLERLRKQTVLAEIRAVDEALLNLTGRATALAKNPDFSSNLKIKNDLQSGIQRCKSTVAIYAECLKKTVLSPIPDLPSEDEQPCTTAFRRDIAEKGSCESLESIAYTIVY